MKIFARAAALVCILAAGAANTAPAAEQADVNRWLEEWAEIRCNPALSDPLWIADAQKAQYAEAAENGNIVTPLMLERIAKNAKNSAEAEKWAATNRDSRVEAVLREQAADDARAQTLLCDILLGGLAGADVDAAQAVEWLRRAAEQGFPLAQNSLGEMHQWGRNGLERDPEQAVSWYRRAAEQGFPFAQSNLGVMYGAGRGVARDEAQAVVWQRRAAEQGYVYAQAALGQRYLNGNGVERDVAQAAAWYAKAAEQGYPGGVSALAKLEEATGAARPKEYASMRNAANQEIGRIFPGGEVRNERNQKIGVIMADGEVRNGGNQTIGRIMPDGEVRNANNQTMGRVMPDGEVRNANNQRIGRVMPGGEVRNGNNSKIGQTRDIETAKEWTAAFYFFFPELFLH